MEGVGIGLAIGGIAGGMGGRTNSGGVSGRGMSTRHRGY